MQDPHFIAHKTYLKDLEAAASSTHLLSQRVGKNTPLLNNKTAVVLTVFLVCATVLPFAI
ncbi:hypothetical protein [Marimonas arenosa]|nr:hypothetical protein [Marimonas arenosa]